MAIRLRSQKIQFSMKIYFQGDCVGVMGCQLQNDVVITFSLQDSLAHCGGSMVWRTPHHALIHRNDPAVRTNQLNHL